MSKSSFIFAPILLDYRQYKYAYQLLILPDGNHTKANLPIISRLGDGNVTAWGATGR